MKQDVYEKINALIVEKLENGIIPWKQPYNVPGCFPKNYVSGREYSGINHFLLQCFGFKDLRFVTYKQAKELGGFIKKGAKGIPVIFWKMIESKRNPDEKIPMIRYYHVFNIKDVEGVDIKDQDPLLLAGLGFDEDKYAEYLIDNMCDLPDFDEKNCVPHYDTIKDLVCLPNRKYFKSTDSYYATLFHEIVHSTGHKDRLNRFKANDEMFNSSMKSYSYEELVAEMGASYLCGLCDFIDNTVDNAAAYIKGWIQYIKDDKTALIKAAAAAHKAVDFLIED